MFCVLISSFIASGCSINVNHIEFPYKVYLCHKNSMISAYHKFIESEKVEYKSIFKVCIQSGI